MSLTNPNPSHIKPGEVRGAGGRPVGSKTRSKSTDIKTRLMAKHKLHPADKLVALGQLFERSGKFDEAAKIWMMLLKYCESPKKQAIIKEEPEPTPALSSELADKILEEFENNGSNPVKSDKGNGVEEESVDVPSETLTEEDISGHTGE